MNGRSTDAGKRGRRDDGGRRRRSAGARDFDVPPLKIITFEPRFVPPYLLPDLSNLWHLSLCAVSGTYTSNGDRRYKRLLWTSAAFVGDHPEHGLSATAVYKDLDDMLSFDGIYRS